MSAALVLVAASVVVGVWGPRLGESRAIDSLIPLGDIALVARRAQRHLELEALHRPSDAALPTSDKLAQVVRENLKVEWTPPDLTDIGYIPVVAMPVPILEGSDAVAILYETEGEPSDRFLALFAIPDSGEFALFDDFGRARVMEPPQVVLEEDDAAAPQGPATLAWTDGTLLFMARADARETLESAHAALGAP